MDDDDDDEDDGRWEITIAHLESLAQVSKKVNTYFLWKKTNKKTGMLSATNFAAEGLLNSIWKHFSFSFFFFFFLLIKFYQNKQRLDSVSELFWNSTV